MIDWDIELKKFENLKKKARKANEAVSAQRRILETECIHPPAYVREYNWKADTGYGVQHKMKGREYWLCNAKDPYNTGTLR